MAISQSQKDQVRHSRDNLLEGMAKTLTEVCAETKSLDSLRKKQNITLGVAVTVTLAAIGYAVNGIRTFSKLESKVDVNTSADVQRDQIIQRLDKSISTTTEQLGAIREAVGEIKGKISQQ